MIEYKICPEAEKGCEGALNPDLFFNRCSGDYEHCSGYQMSKQLLRIAERLELQGTSRRISEEEIVEAFARA